ncbi:MAG: hypothetical protein IPG45_04380 [Deltaproteobacteria bacterium]|nr:hypothetical protein [Deltaproteobacteria bacterium]
MRALTLFLFTTLLGACATSFTGSATVRDGAAGCERRCQELGMELAGMVLLGEYSDGCVCQKPGQKVDAPAAAGATAAGAVGVVMQTRRADRHSSVR